MIHIMYDMCDMYHMYHTYRYDNQTTTVEKLVMRVIQQEVVRWRPVCIRAFNNDLNMIGFKRTHMIVLGLI